MDETPISPTKECVLKCNEPRQLFDFPSKHALRTLWLYKLGLDKYDEHLQVCDRHFSQTNQSEITIPDQNLPENTKGKESYDRLIERIMNSKILGRTDNIRLIENVSCVTIKEANPLPQRNDGLSGNECPSTEVKGAQTSNANITLSQNEHDSSVIEKESEPPSVSNTGALESASTVIDEDLDPISVFMRIATDESASITIDVSSIPTSECRKITDVSSNEIEDQSHTIGKNESVSRFVEDMREEYDFTSSIIEETLIENRELTEKELSMIIEEDPEIEEALPATIESQPDLPPADVPSTSSGTLPPSKSNSAPKTKENLMNDTSTFLLDYQLCIQGKYMCDVIEIPEYVVVITIPKAKELRPATLSKKNDLDHFKKKENVRSLLDIPPSITISRTLSEEEVDGSESQQTEEIDYVYYMGEDENPRRDREVQVDIEIKTKDSANQCDVELDINMIPISHQSKLRNRPADFNKHECLVCGEILLNYSAQVKHYALHECELTSLCSYCGARFANPQKLIAHEKYFHVGIMMEIKEPLRCPRLYCQKAFHSKKQLYSHIDEHIGIVGHKCYICERVFTSAVQLFRHQKISNLCLRRKIWKQRQFFRRMLES